jgi:hypothetical protein
MARRRFSKRIGAGVFAYQAATLVTVTVFSSVPALPSKVDELIDRRSVPTSSVAGGCVSTLDKRNNTVQSSIRTEFHRQ